MSEVGNLVSNDTLQELGDLKYSITDFIDIKDYMRESSIGEKEAEQISMRIVESVVKYGMDIYNLKSDCCW